MGKQKLNYFFIFLFPLRPIKTFRSVVILCILGFFIALAIALNAISIRIPGIGMSISFTWLPTMIIGWFFGPIIGLFLGALIDTLNWLIFGGFWFWLYAIQEPCVGFFVGILSSLYRLYFFDKNKIKITLIINQLFMFVFLILTLFFVFYYTSNKNILYDKLVSTGQIPEAMNTIFRYLISGFLIVFTIIIETIVIINYKKIIHNKNNQQNRLLIFLFSMIICITSTFIFSFILGPISAIKYYEFVYNKTPPNLLKYGAIYYLLPRIIKECIKTPIYISLLSIIIYSINPVFQKVKSIAINTYAYDKK